MADVTRILLGATGWPPRTTSGSAFCETWAANPCHSSRTFAI
jgi:hypothetical protein